MLAMNKHIDLNAVFTQFDTKTAIAPYGNGHINDTYCCEPTKYILQKINTSIFTDPDALMENIERVTAFLGNKIKEAGGDPERETLTVIKTKDGKNFYRYDDENVFRMYTFITHTKSIEGDKTLTDLYNAGKGFGKFQQMLSDYPADTLHETIRDFHHTAKRVEALKTAISENKAGRAASVQAEIDFALKHASCADTVLNGIASGEILLRVTHNDTKINNVLFDSDTDKAICVIDLDTVMPGLALHDYGDAVRFSANAANEDEPDTSKIYLDRDKFIAFTKGFLASCGKVLTDAEKENLVDSVIVIAMELASRFLDDYLTGDTYFKVDYPGHNLVRTRAQITLAKDIIARYDELNEAIKNLL